MKKSAEKKVDVERLSVLLERLKRHRAWIDGYQQGSGKRVPFEDDVRLLHIELESAIDILRKKNEV